ncbi:hypothetical protein ICJ04_11600 [Stenotrophomonas sp. 169]|uniref:hypothetical protein n=1 Tax=Stenotrophomonas sp. 169 TaxID=2770322 RepID=UPI0016627D73|nr:hypothetical protein [Stenotrophomonas sp. 169]QNR96189.1 hypothetical protein ICJ04_11600 [Stenotrophomonas sp. 169]
MRVQRLQAIIGADVRAEGIEVHTDDGVTYYGPHGQGDVRHDLAFRDLWTSTGTDWESYSWAWVIGFRPLEAGLHHAASDTTKETRDGRS